MANYRQGPRLIHEGSKSEGLFYQLPQSMVANIFQNFDGKNGNQIKLLIVLLGNKGDGTFRLTEAWIMQQTGMTKSNYHRTMDALEEKGYVTRENGKVILNLPLLTEAHHEDKEGTHQDCKSTHDDEKVAHDDDYNIKIINNNNNNEKSVDDQKQMIRELLGCVHIDYAPNTHKAMTDIIGEEPQAHVLAELIVNNLTALKKAANKPQSYRYGILAKQLKAEYHTLKKQASAKAPLEDTADSDDPLDLDELLDDLFSGDDL